ncbi:lipoprotein precursor [Flavobacterium limnosediminis JC2902]|uniref:Lipoprotein n=1 Tax=Flavobacterium limnosediminis JC2902 TaxID=1341181 RepID=V6SNL9_9FLAO|nr:hypothetical protein [Flavobacterium limnosediminis]ESU28186.1 lipoprotein precursor [Flavobacterium limnosediminis JC2902]
MKKRFYLLAAVFSGLLLSCSSDDSDNGGNNSSDTNFTIPLTIGKYWTYDVEGEGVNTRDSLYISNDTIIAGNTYKKFKTRENLATGFYSSSLRNNGVREVDHKLLLSGDLSLADGQQLPIGLDLSLLDFIIFKKNATNGEVLSTKSGSFQQTVESFPLTINYTLQSKGGETIPNFTSPNGDTYTNVRTSKIVLRVTITTVISGLPITVLPAQDVITSTQYVADGIGVVYTNTVTTYNINEYVASELGIPSTNTQTQEEFLDTHN